MTLKTAAASSIVQSVNFIKGLKMYVKRDDLFSPLSGNKFRKLYWLWKKPCADLLDTSLYSYGGVQSNAMLAIAQLAKEKNNIPFYYFTRPLPKHTLSQHSNFQMSLRLGMKHIELQPEDYDTLVETQDIAPWKQSHLDNNSIFIPQGGEQPQAEVGVAILAQEIIAYYKEENLNELVVLMPSGTGTTAKFLSKHLQSEGCKIKLVTVSVVHDQLNIPNATVLFTKRRFAALRKEYWELYNSLLPLKTEDGSDNNIEFDLIYGIPTWHAFLKHFDDSMLADFQTCGKRRLMYIHTGGLSGNASQIERYKNMMERQGK